MHRKRIRAARTALAIAASLCLLAAPALAGDRSWEQARWHPLNARFLSDWQNPSMGAHWFESPLQNEEKPLFGYSRNLDWNPEREFLFSIQGPVVGERAHGLTFELRF